jgi:hypothetical protein
MGYPDILSTLLEAAPSLHTSPALRTTALGSTALHLAAVSGVQECVAALLADDTKDVNVLDQVSTVPSYHFSHIALCVA